MNYPEADRAFAAFRKQSDPESLALVFDLTAQPLYKYAFFLCSDSDFAEDLVQTAFLKAIEGAEQYDPEKPVMPWLKGILHNRFLAEQRQQSRQIDPQRIPTPDPVPEPITALANSEYLGIAQRSIESLPDHLKEVMSLYVLQGKDTVEIATRLGRPTGTVRTQLVRGRELLARQLPKGMALATLLLLLQVPGLTAVRSRVIAAAGGKAAVATGWAAALKYGLLGVAALLVATITYLLLQDNTPPGTEPLLEGVIGPRGDNESPAPRPDTSGKVAPTDRQPLPEVIGTTPVEDERNCITGSVVDALTGSPLPDALASLIRPLSKFILPNRSGPLYGNPISVQTDGRGNFVLKGLVENSTCLLSVTHPGYLPRRKIPVQALAGSHRIGSIALSPPASLRVEVTGPGSTPLAGARVLLIPLQGRRITSEEMRNLANNRTRLLGERPGATEPGLACLTDQAGAGLITMVPGGRYLATACREGYRFATSAPLSLAMGQQETVALSLEPGQDIWIETRNASGRPLPEALVILSYQADSGRVTHYNWSDARGRAWLGAHPRTIEDIQVQAHLTLKSGARLASAKEGLDGFPEQPHTLLLSTRSTRPELPRVRLSMAWPSHLSSQASLAFVFFDPKVGRGLPGEKTLTRVADCGDSIELECPGPGTWQVLGFLEGVGFGTSTSFRAEKDRIAQARLSFVKTANQRLQGRALNAQGEAAAGALVTLHVPNVPDFPWPFRTHRADRWLPFLRTRCDEQGMFTLCGLRQGEYRIILQHHRWGTIKQDFSFPDGPGRNQLNLVFRAQGQIEGSCPKTAGDCLVVLEDMEGTLCRVRTWRPGETFRFSGLPEGNYHLRIEPGISVPIRLPMMARTIGHKIALGPGERMFVELDTAEGNSGEAAQLEILVRDSGSAASVRCRRLGPQGGPVVSTILVQGRTRCRLDGAGTYLVTVHNAMDRKTLGWKILEAGMGRNSLEMNIRTGRIELAFPKNGLTKILACRLRPADPRVQPETLEFACTLEGEGEDRVWVRKDIPHGKYLAEIRTADTNKWKEVDKEITLHGRAVRKEIKSER